MTRSTKLLSKKRSGLQKIGPKFASVLGMQLIQLNILLFITMTLFGVNSFGIDSKNGILSEPIDLLNRACVLEYSTSSGKKEILSGFLVDSSTIVSAGHALYFMDDLKIKCGITGSKTFRDKDRWLHPNYDYRHNPPSIDAWAKYDFSVIQINAENTVRLNRIKIISNPETVANLIRSEQCIYGGAGSSSSDSIRWSNVKFVKTPSEIYVHNENHIAVLYSGQPIVVGGDSGGPLLCQTNAGDYVLAGLLEYAGNVKNENTSVSRNIVGISLIRNEILDFINGHVGP